MEIKYVYQGYCKFYCNSLRHTLVPRINILINLLPIRRYTYFIIYFGKVVPEDIADKVINLGFGFLFVRPVIELGNFCFD